MILTKTPLRISFVGGGSDRPSFYREEAGACVAAAIDKYVYVAVNGKYDGTIRAAYSRTENVERVGDLEHELIRGALGWVKHERGIEIHSIADIPAGTGLGSSSSFTVGLLAGLFAHAKAYWNAPAVAKVACEIEIRECNKPIGKQDQYAAAFGGLNLYRFLPDETVTVAPIACDTAALSRHCLLLDTGRRRAGDAGAILQGQHQRREDVRALAALAPDFAGALSQNDFGTCGALLAEAWQLKRQFIADDRIDQFYTTARRAGAWGGKLCGAGGGGFLLFLAPPERHQAIITALGLRAVPITVGVAGTAVVYGE